MARVTKAIIPVAGMGTRFLPATKSIPKEMMPVVDKPVIQYLVEEAVEAGIETIIFVTSKQKHAIQAHFSRDKDFEGFLRRAKKYDFLDKVRNIHNLAEFVYVSQDEPLGSGDAVSRAKRLIGDEPFAVFYADDIIGCKKPAIAQLIEAHEECGGAVLGLFLVPKKDVHLYGIAKCRTVSGSDSGILNIEQLIEKPSSKNAPSRLASVGRFVFTPEIFDKIKKTKKIKGEFYLADAIDMLAREGKVFGWEIDGTWYDCGSKAGFLRANIELAMAHPQLGIEMRKILKNI